MLQPPEKRIHLNLEWVDPSRVHVPAWKHRMKERRLRNARKLEEGQVVANPFDRQRYPTESPIVWFDWEPLNGPGDWEVLAKYRGKIVGRLQATVDADRMHVADLEVSNAVPRPWPIFDRLLVFILKRRKLQSFRGRGIGTEMLQLAILEADRTGLREIWGSVAKEDAARTPGLLDWYTRHGFTVGERDQECSETAEWKIVRMRDERLRHFGSDEEPPSV